MYCEIKLQIKINNNTAPNTDGMFNRLVTPAWPLSVGQGCASQTGFLLVTCRPASQKPQVFYQPEHISFF